MSENNSIHTSLDKAIENLTDAPTQTIGQTLSDVLYLVFGGINYTAQKRKLEYSYKLQQFENTLKEKVSEIPESQQRHPDIQTVGQALNDAKYCLEDDVLRQMFCELISSSMDKRKAEFTHPSFSNTIKRMSPLDARNILLFYPNRQFPIVDFRVINNETDTSFLIMKNVFLDNTVESNLDHQAISISVLESLGLVCIDEAYKTLDNESYALFEKTTIFQKLREEYKDLGRFVILKKICRLTNYGIYFLKTCASDSIRKEVYSSSSK